MIRFAVHEDLPHLIDMGRRFCEVNGLHDIIPFDGPSAGTTLVRLMESTSHCLFVAEENQGVPIGMAAAVVWPHYWNHDHLTGQEMFWWVDPEHRKGQHGRELLKMLEQWARSKGATAFMMAALEAQRPDVVERLYVRRGYHPSSRVFVKGLQDG